VFYYFIYKKIRTGNATAGIPGLETLFSQYKVDVSFGGHEHCYQRTLPVYNKTVIGTDFNGKIYDNPKAPVYIITGAAVSKRFNENLITLIK